VGFATSAKREQIDLLSWSALKEIHEKSSEVVAQETVAKCHLYQFAFALRDYTNDNNTHKGHIAIPIRILRDHAARVLPCACVYFFLDALWKVVILEIVGDLSRIVCKLRDEYACCLLAVRMGELTPLLLNRRHRLLSWRSDGWLEERPGELEALT
jgi:hypothetical protein